MDHRIPHARTTAPAATQDRMATRRIVSFARRERFPRGRQNPQAQVLSIFSPCAADYVYVPNPHAKGMVTRRAVAGVNWGDVILP